MRLPRFHLLLLLAAVPAITHAQDSTTSAPAARPSPAAEKPAQSPPPVEKKKPKKVWTNDDISSVKGDVSVVGERDFSEDSEYGGQSYQANRAKDLHQRQIAYYRNQIQQLQSQIDAADKRIAQLKNFKGENTTPAGGISPAQSYNMVPLTDQVKQLEDRRKQLQSKIQDVESDARKNGIEPGELR